MGQSYNCSDVSNAYVEWYSVNLIGKCIAFKMRCHIDNFNCKRMHFRVMLRRICIDVNSMVSCQKGPTRHASAWQKGPIWQDTLELLTSHKLIGNKKLHFIATATSCRSCIGKLFYRMANIYREEARGRQKDTGRKSNGQRQACKQTYIYIYTFKYLHAFPLNNVAVWNNK